MGCLLAALHAPIIHLIPTFRTDSRLRVRYAHPSCGYFGIDVCTQQRKYSNSLLIIQVKTIIDLVDTAAGVARDQIATVKATVSKTLEQKGLIQAKA